LAGEDLVGLDGEARGLEEGDEDRDGGITARLSEGVMVDVLAVRVVSARSAEDGKNTYPGMYSSNSFWMFFWTRKMLAKSWKAAC
jgi:hypothetical protein